MAEDLFGQRLSQAHEHGGPDNGVETDDLFAHKVDVGGPELAVIIILVVAVAQSSDVVGQGVHPHIDHMTRVKIYRDAPGKGGAGDTQIFQPWLNKVIHHLVDPGAGLQEVRVL